MKILILGGTGAMGIPLTKILSDGGHLVFVTTRKNRIKLGNIEFMVGNAKDEIFFESLLTQSWDVIIDFMIYSIIEFENRFERILQTTNHYIFTSSARVYADSIHPITERTARLIDESNDAYFLSISEYSTNKSRQEDMLLNSAYSNYSIIRPYITYNENRLQLGVFEKEEWLYRALKGRSIVFPFEMKEKMTTLTYGQDVALAISKIVEKRNVSGEIFNITSPKCHKWKDVLAIYLVGIERFTGIKNKVVYVDNNHFLKFRQGDSKFQFIYDRLFDRRFDCSKMQELVDINSFTDFEIGSEKCLKGFIENGTFTYINWVHEAIKDKYSKEYTALHEISGFKNKIRYLIYRFF